MPETSKKGLGRGFEALLPTDFNKSILYKEDRIENIELNKLTPNPNQPRKHFGEVSLNELSDSIKRHGIIQPLVASPKNGKYYIVAGERRWRAAKIAGLKTVPVIVKERKDLEQLEVALIENVQRVDLNSIEQALSIEKLNQEFNIPINEIAKRLGKASSTVINIVRLLNLPDNAKKALIENKISEGHARQILAVESKEQQDYLLRSIINNHWTVRKAEQFVVGLRKSKELNKAKEHTKIENVHTKFLTKKLSTPVTIRRTAHGGKLEISFKDDQELQRIVKLFQSR